MIPRDFPEANTRFHPPQDLEESQCRTIPAYLGNVEQGSVEGSPMVVVAYVLSIEDILYLKSTVNPTIFLTCLGGLPPHFLSLDFHTATHPA